MLECRSVDLWFVEETRFKEKSVRMISGKQCKLFGMRSEKGLGGV